MKKKIVFIAESLYGGGVERILQIVLSHFNYNRYDVTLFTVRKNVIDAKIFPAGIKYKYIFDIPKDESSILHKVLYFKGKESSSIILLFSLELSLK